MKKMAGSKVGQTWRVDAGLGLGGSREHGNLPGKSAAAAWEERTMMEARVRRGRRFNREWDRNEAEN